MMKYKKALFVGIGLLIVILVITRISIYTWDIDVNSGRMREQTCIGSLVISEKVRDTKFSTYATSFLSKGTPAEWRRDRSKTLWDRISPRYRYHGAENALKEFMLVSEMAQNDEEKKRDEAQKVLMLLKAGNIMGIEKLNLRIYQRREDEAKSE